MFKKIIALGIVLMLGIPCYAEKRITIEQIIDKDEASSMTVASTATLYTKSFSLKNTEEMAVLFQATSDTTTPQISFYLQQSYRRPTAEGCFDFTYSDVDLIQSDRTDYRWGCATYSTLAPLPFGRFKLVGGSSNPADTVVQMRIGKQ